MLFRDRLKHDPEFLCTRRREPLRWNSQANGSNWNPIPNYRNGYTTNSGLIFLALNCISELSSVFNFYSCATLKLLRDASTRQLGGRKYPAERS
ncbi:hypothetical protein CSING_05005 [Corynebacterium singulare]|uniref:Uncharacterized protein n=1 Tax=Corynebacterium singulare TaxID=161899 RepID=A0A0B6F263_9CORY|nr:hypothetical protein CSING_05005 [Corynebacterium singulare]